MVKNQRLIGTDKRDSKNMPGAQIPLGSTFIGDFETKSSVRIDGSVKGNVTAAGNIDIGPEGKVEGMVTGQDIHIAGSIAGDLHSSNSVLLLSGAKLMGDLSATSLIIEEGAYFKGHCTINKQAIKSDDGQGAE